MFGGGLFEMMVALKAGLNKSTESSVNLGHSREKRKKQIKPVSKTNLQSLFFDRPFMWSAEL